MGGVGTESCADVKKKNLTPPIVIAVSKKNLSVFPTSMHPVMVISINGSTCTKPVLINPCLLLPSGLTILVLCFLKMY